MLDECARERMACVDRSVSVSLSSFIVEEDNVDLAFRVFAQFHGWTLALIQYKSSLKL